MGKLDFTLNDRVWFSFKSLSQDGISYDAGYSPVDLGGESNWLDLTQMPGSFPHFYREEAWKLFRNNATFNDILDGQRAYNILDVIHKTGKPNFNDLNQWSETKFLAEIGKHPDWLAIPETGALERFIFTMRVASEANSDKSHETINNLKDYFIPKRPGGSKSLPVNLTGILYLLTDLAKHFSNLCREHLRDAIPGDRTAQIKEWLTENNESRIIDSVLVTPPSDITFHEKISLLIETPVKFAEIILAGDLRMSPSSLHSALYK